MGRTRFRGDDGLRGVARIELGEFIMPVDIGVDRGAHPVLLGDELNHHAFERLTGIGRHVPFGAPKHALSICRGRRVRQTGECQGDGGYPGTPSGFRANGHCPLLHAAKNLMLSL